METVKRKSNISGTSRYLKPVEKMGKGMLVIMAVMCFMQANAQEKKQVITINGTSFAYPLIERWISEYSKIKPDLDFRLIRNQENTGQADLNVIAYTPDGKEAEENKTLVRVGRYAVLPITNEKNPSFSREFKKGIGQKGLKSIFLKSDWEEDGLEKENAGEPAYTVYTKTPQSHTAKLISSYLGKPAEELQGVYVTGDDKYLITSVLEDSTGVTYNNLGLIYDLKKRTPVEGIKILPIDLNNNGRLDKEEQIYGNLDQVLAFLENSKKAQVPTDYVSFVTDLKSSNPEVADFINWVRESGQEYNHQYGFLSVQTSSYNTLSLK
jgi:ABC-type phosphate transport system substrate-binding protein